MRRVPQAERPHAESTLLVWKTDKRGPRGLPVPLDHLGILPVTQSRLFFFIHDSRTRFPFCVQLDMVESRSAEGPRRAKAMDSGLSPEVCQTGARYAPPQRSSGDT